MNKENILKFKKQCDWRKFEFSLGFYCWKIEKWVSVKICNDCRRDESWMKRAESSMKKG